MLLSLLAVAHGATWPEIEPPPATGEGERDAAVIVGIDAYPFLDDVPGARANAEDWFRYLTRTRGLSPARVLLLRDVEGTREKVLKALDRAASEVGPDGRVWLVFIGHGAPTPDGRDGALVGADAQADPDSLFARSVTRAEVLGALEGKPAVLVLDACFSGRSGRGSLLPDLQLVVPTWATAPPAQATVLTAGTATQFAGPLPGAGRPAFSYLVLGALTGWGDADADGVVTAAEAVGWATEAITATVRGRDQTPELLGPDVVLGAAGTSTPPDLVELALGPTFRPATGAALPADELEARRAAVEARQLAARREQEALEAAAAATRARLDDAADALLAEARHRAPGRRVRDRARSARRAHAAGLGDRGGPRARLRCRRGVWPRDGAPGRAGRGRALGGGREEARQARAGGPRVLGDLTAISAR